MHPFIHLESETPECETVEPKPEAEVEVVELSKPKVIRRLFLVTSIPSTPARERSRLERPMLAPMVPLGNGTIVLFCYIYYSAVSALFECWLLGKT
uniref:Uncharacterized protein n=1 Tax=Arundo donax TaxID=35708 RepID=A0A0A9B9X7_ARUDO